MTELGVKERFPLNYFCMEKQATVFCQLLKYNSQALSFLRKTGCAGEKSNGTVLLICNFGQQIVKVIQSCNQEE